MFYRFANGELIRLSLVESIHPLDDYGPSLAHDAKIRMVSGREFIVPKTEANAIAELAGIV